MHTYADEIGHTLERWFGKFPKLLSKANTCTSSDYCEGLFCFRKGVVMNFLFLISPGRDTSFLIGFKVSDEYIPQPQYYTVVL